MMQMNKRRDMERPTAKKLAVRKSLTAARRRVLRCFNGLVVEEGRREWAQPRRGLLEPPM